MTIPASNSPMPNCDNVQSQIIQRFNSLFHGLLSPILATIPTYMAHKKSISFWADALNDSTADNRKSVIIKTHGITREE